MLLVVHIRLKEVTLLELQGDSPVPKEFQWRIALGKVFLLVLGKDNEVVEIDQSDLLSGPR